MTSLERFDVCIVRLAFEDKPEISKPRPVICYEISDDQVSFISVKVTSHEARDGFPGEVQLLDWQQEGLRKPSVARCSKATLLELRDVRAIIGHLTQRDIESVIAGVREASRI